MDRAIHPRSGVHLVHLVHETRPRPRACPHPLGRAHVSALALVAGALALAPAGAGAATDVRFGTVSTFDSAAALDLEGDIVYAVNFSNNDGPLTVNGVTFVPDTQAVPGASFVGPNEVTPWQSRPALGNTADDDALEEILSDIRWANSAANQRLEANLAVTEGLEYQLQLLISGNHQEDRFWDIVVEDRELVDEISSLGLAPGHVYDPGAAVVFTYRFVARDGEANVVMGNLFGENDGGDRNPIWQALTLEKVTIPPTPESVAVEPEDFFPTLEGRVGRLVAEDFKADAAHLFSLVAGAGDTDNARFEIDGEDLLAGAHDFGGDDPGTTYQIRVRTTDAEDPTRFLEAALTLTLTAAVAPSAITLSAASVNAGAVVGATVGQLGTVDPNPADAHTYALVPGAGAEDNALFRVEGEWVRVAQPIPGGRAEVRFRVRSSDLSGLSLERAFVLSVTEPSLRINEFMASNGATLEDEDGDASDWVEIFNELAQEVNLEGWYLTDDPGRADKWRLPSVRVGANAFLLVFASGKDRGSLLGGELHTNFQLDSGGEYLALVEPDGVTLAAAFAFPRQRPDISFGHSGTGEGTGFLRTPTPGEPNGETADQVENAVTFSHPRGYYDAAFPLALTAAVPGSVIRYTTDGSEPTASRGTVYDEPFTVGPETGGARRGTRRVRAVALDPAAAFSPVATHTYLFVRGTGDPGAEGVVGQSVFRSTITDHPTYGPLLDESLLALPAVSITKSGGIGGSEQETSIELFDRPGGTEAGFQIDCGIKVVGGASVGSPKNNFRLYFRGRYGESKLRYPLFAGHPYSRGAAESFDVLQLRSGSHDNFYWLALPGNPPVGSRHGDAQYVRNRWISDMEFLMGHDSLHGRFVHLYLNGTYHGLYHFHERPMHHFQASYHGGEPEDHHYTNSARNGSSHAGGNWSGAWASMRSAAGSGMAAAREWIDVVNLADYMLLNFYCGNSWDWSSRHNWMAGGPAAPGRGGWKFYSWDSDIMLQDVANNNLGVGVPDGVFAAMMGDPDFRVLFRDRVYKFCFNGGLLTPGKIGASYDYRMNEIFDAIVAETARWQPGSAISLPWDRDGEWQVEWDYMTDTFWPQRTDILLGQLRARGWYPVEAPALEPRGGAVPAGFRPLVSAPAGSVYYTTDGSDPRLPGGAPNPGAELADGSVATRTLIPLGADWKYLDDGSDQGTAWREPGFEDGAWAAGPAQLGYGEFDEATVISFGGNGSAKHLTTYFRHTFTLGDPAGIAGLTINLRRDDGAIVYLNGREVARTNLPAGTVDFQTLAANATDDGEELLTFSLAPVEFTLVEGDNVVAVEVHQQSGASSDLSFDLALFASEPAEPSALEITSNTVVRARALVGGEWSALEEVSFVLEGTVPAGGENIIVSEIHYNPAGPDETEFLELHNPSASPAELSGATLGGAVAFTFPLGTVLPAGGYLVVVEDEAAFAGRYADPASPWFFPGIQVAGQWEGGLGNGGEPITLAGADGSPLLSFRYRDGGAWPGRADGDGSSAELELDELTSAPPAGPDRDAFFADGGRWRPSGEYHGSPGRAGTGPDNRVVINEVLAHSEAPEVDRVELLNRSGGEIGVGGWFLTDSADVPRKYQLAPGTTLAPGGVLVLDEGDFNNPGAPRNPFPFALNSSQGDDVYLLAADAGGNLLGFVDRVSFGASAPGEAFGRWPDGDGDLYPMLSLTFGEPNDTGGNRVRVGPVVVSEIHYNPPGEDAGLEFVEVVNAGAATEDLANWRLRGEADFDFAAEDLAPGGVLVLVGFDPDTDTVSRDAFLAAYPGVDPDRLRGPWSAGSGNQLDNGGAPVRLQRPGELETPPGADPFFPRLIEDTVNYRDGPPWPAEADAAGASLHRLRAEVYGDAPENWVADDPSPGSYSAPDDPYPAWAAEHGLGDGPDGLPGGDFDRDGIPNFLEFALGDDPLGRGLGRLPRLALTVIPGGGGGGVEDEVFLTLTFRRRSPPPAGLVYTVEVSSDLVTWESTSAQVGETTDNGDGTETVTVRDNSPVGGAGLRGGRFIRLAVGGL